MEFVKERLVNVRKAVQGYLEDAETQKQLCKIQVLDSELDYGETLMAAMEEYSEVCDRITAYKVELATLDGHLENISKMELTSARIGQDLKTVEKELAELMDRNLIPPQ
ncbi:hypothetical protein CAEBREN_18146 [Caenorhabditis brenneri]|uniref:Uncharacterized protein n=1 Tax=Caenorhabditis brenneri TaxID=135651 RepID=G0PG77_CAEBE|nr:hypothetical protein CAEBREN_18146 [Caenorhabditis brenneri]